MPEYKHYIGVKPREGYWNEGDWDEGAQSYVVLIAFADGSERDEEAAYWNKPPMEWEYVPLTRDEALAAQELGDWAPCEPDDAWTRGECDCRAIVVS